MSGQRLARIDLMTINGETHFDVSAVLGGGMVLEHSKGATFFFDAGGVCKLIEAASAALALAGLTLEPVKVEPIPMRLFCTRCGELHVDEGEFATKVHHTHACQTCGEVWRPAVVPTVGVRFLPGFKNESANGGGK